MKHNLGQHFINSESLTEDIVGISGVSIGDTVFEIGPGRGALTELLLKTGARVVAVEKDPSLVMHLNTAYKEYADKKQLVCSVGDIRDGIPEILTGVPYCVVANIPYYITGAVVRTLLTADHQPKHITLLVQNEVAKRITHKTKESVLSLSVKLFGVPRYIRRVERSSFTPSPEVDSAIIHISDIHPQPEKVQKIFFSIVKRAFASKRKKLSNTLLKEDIAVLARFDVSPDARPEDVPFSVWYSIAVS